MTQNMSSAIYDEYEKYLITYQKEYGPNTVVLLQVGSFYEMYSIDNGLLDLKLISESLNITLTRKNKTAAIENPKVSKNNCYMSGFPEHALTKYMNLLLDNNYTVVVVSQVTQPPKPKREVTDIKSPGTRIDEIHASESNFLMSVYFEELYDYRTMKHILSAGMSLIDVSTGQSFSLEATSKPDDKFYALDEVYRVIVSYNPREIVLFGDLVSLHSLDIIKHLEIEQKCTHNMINNYEKVVKQITRQNKILEKCFPEHGLLSPIEYLDLERKMYAATSYVQLLDFSYKHSEKILDKIQKPVILEDESYTILSYNTAKQLNVIGGDYCKLSLVDILNNCKTAIGKRRFRHRLLNPRYCPDLLNKEYDNVQSLIDNDMYIHIGKLLSSISDIERLVRKMVLHKLSPSEFPNILLSLEQVMLILDVMVNIPSYRNPLPNVATCTPKVLSELKEYLNLEKAQKFHIDNISENIFHLGKFSDLDILQSKYENYVGYFHTICDKLNEQIKDKFFKLETNDKEGYYIVITSKRFDNVLPTLKSFSLENSFHPETFDIKKLDAKKISSGATVVRLCHPDFKIMNDRVNDTQSQLRKLVLETYCLFLDNISHKYNSVFQEIVKFIGDIDYHYVNAYNAIKFKYCRPIIKPNATCTSYIDAKSIRHPIIERIQTEVEYIANDVDLSISDKDGMLLYGVNASGKSSLMKSVGLSVIMASAGMFVPCSSFTFYPYKSIFTRIPTGDNLSKGQSTFTNEISELRDILKRACNRSLVIGDELCSGTESVSAMSIVSAGIITLCQRKTSFIFATHLHDLIQIEKVKNLKNLEVYHLSVEYDNVNDMLIYDRKLQKGQGTTLYGLEVMKGLGMNKEFIDLANDIRHELLDIDEHIVSTKSSKYNSKLFRDVCVFCKKKSTEVHHIKEQRFADKNGFIGNIHKNSLYNLINVCDSCHDEIHNGNIIIKDGFKTTTKGTKLF